MGNDISNIVLEKSNRTLEQIEQIETPKNNLF